MNKKVLRAGAVSAVAAGIGAAAVMAGKRRSKKEEENSDYRNTELGKFAKNSKGIYYTNGNYEAFARPEKPEGIEEKSAYLVGSGLAALAAACFLVRDAQMPGKNIHILEAMDVAGGACDGIDDPTRGYVMRGGREMEDHFECLWDLFRSIPSLEVPNASVLDEYYWLNKHDPNYSLCRATEKRGEDAHTDGKFRLSQKGSMEIMKLFFTRDEDLYDKSIEDFFDDEVFGSDFWLYWRTMFAFENWHSALEMKRYFQRFIHHIGGLPDFSALKFTRYNQYESLILPMQKYLEAAGVQIQFGTSVTNVRFDIEGEKKTAKAIAGIDVFCSLSSVATRRNYVKPSINEKGVIQIKNGRHPVVEQMMRDDLFVANDTFLDNGKNRLSIITGPNMAGKSTYMRQTALIVLMAQLGSFVPAQEANIGICDRIFTRVGASDDLASGQSTFMVEMTEVANILRNATRNSLLVLDEIGRGTSTFDGLSIAWAVVEHISNTKLLGAKTLFATHYHELTELEGTIAGVKNYCIAVKEQGDDIVFLRKIVRGGADKSYGIQVAKLAGVPDSVISRAKEIASELTENDITAKAKEIAAVSANVVQHKAVPKPDEVDMQQMSFFDTVKDDDIIKELDGLELSTMTPIDAMNTLYRLQTRLKNRWKENL